MSVALRIIYESMPVFGQNVMVSTKGLALYMKRYGGKYRQYVDGLMRSQWLTAQQFRDIQTSKLRELLTAAVREVPYYRRAFAPFASSLEGFGLDNLSELPLLDGALLRKNTREFLDRSRLKHGHDDGHTSGTSGSPLVWPIDLDSFQFSMALVERHYRWAGVTTNQRSARFTGRVIAGRRSSPPYWRYNVARNQWLFSVYHLSDSTLPAYYEALQRISPAYIESYPSAILSVAKWVNKHRKEHLWRPWAVFTGGETLLDFQRKEIESAFGCRVFNFYGSAEGAPVISECAAGRLHLNPESGIVEFIKPSGAQAGPGELAEMVVTSFRQRSMPLIRYRIGDTAVLAERQTCPCGREMPIIERIEGRESDTLRSAERGLIGSASLSTLLYCVPSRIAESQIEQVTEQEFVFRYVPIGGPLTVEEQQLVSVEFRNRLGDTIALRLEVCDGIPKSESGKTRLIVGLDRQARRVM